MQSQMEDMVRTALAGDPNVLIQARMPGGILYDSSADNFTGTDPPNKKVRDAFKRAVDVVSGTAFAYTHNLPHSTTCFLEVYKYALMLSYQRQNQVTFDPETVTSQLMQNVRMTEQLLDQTKSALHGSDAVVELSRAGQPVLAKLEAIEARLTQIESRSNDCCVIL